MNTSQSDYHDYDQGLTGESDEDFARRLQALELGQARTRAADLAGTALATNAASGAATNAAAGPTQAGTPGRVIQIYSNQLSPQSIMAVTIILFWPQIFAALIILPEHWNDSSPCSDATRDLWKIWVAVQTVRIFILSSLTLWLNSQPALFATNPLLKHRVSKVVWACEIFGIFWLIMGNIWLFGNEKSNGGMVYCGHAFESPVHNLVLTMVILSYLQLLAPCILALLMIPVFCCCMPCLIRVLARMQSQGRPPQGATLQTINEVPTVTMTAEHFKARAAVAATPLAAPGTATETDAETELELESEAATAGGSVTGSSSSSSNEATEVVEITCSICLCDMQVGDEARLLPCKHYFHKACIDQWMAVNAVCPTCRTEIFPGRISRQQNQHANAGATAAADSGTGTTGTINMGVGTSGSTSVSTNPPTTVGFVAAGAGSTTFGVGIEMRTEGGADSSSTFTTTLLPSRNSSLRYNSLGVLGTRSIADTTSAPRSSQYSVLPSVETETETGGATLNDSNSSSTDNYVNGLDDSNNSDGEHERLEDSVNSTGPLLIINSGDTDVCMSTDYTNTATIDHGVSNSNSGSSSTGGSNGGSLEG